MSGEPTESEGVVDSIRDGIAVILVGEDEAAVELPSDELPPDAAEGSRVQVTTNGEIPVRVELVEAAPPTVGLRERLVELGNRRVSKRLRRGGS